VREPKDFGKDMEAARQYLESGRSRGYGPISGLLNWLSSNAFGADKVWTKAAKRIMFDYTEVASPHAQDAGVSTAAAAIWLCC
jgi:hypothetical protein